MSPVRILVLTLMVCAPLLFAQEKSLTSSGSAAQASPTINIAGLATPESQSTDSKNPLFEARNFVLAPETAEFAEFKNPGPEEQAFVIAPGGGEDTLCFAIRSYVVARDSKNSDATHPVGYSTCRPAKRYGVKKVGIAPQRPVQVTR
jgi:hypothetical protein